MTISRKERILGGLWGSLVGDALGVPVEFVDREDLKARPVAEMVGQGTHDQPAGTWSDDSSLILCTVESLLRRDFDPQDIGNCFVEWRRDRRWTPHGEIFDIGMTTSEALGRVACGIPAHLAGGTDQFSNGNGSLMRIIPISLAFCDAPIPVLLERVHRASAITHRHPRSQMACGFHALVTRRLLAGENPREAFYQARESFSKFYETSEWAPELSYFRPPLQNGLEHCAEAQVDSSGYVIETLRASLWCLLSTSAYDQCVLKAVNLGGDSDTTGCVAGGLAGVYYGVQNIPQKWRTALARYDDVTALFTRFGEAICMRQ